MNHVLRSCRVAVARLVVLAVVGFSALPALAQGAAAGSAAAPAAAGSAAAAPAAGVKVLPWYDKLAQTYTHEGNYWTPPAAGAAGDGSDFMYYAVLGLSAFFFFAIAGAIVYFVWRYRHRPGHKAEPSAAHNDVLEITWTVIPTIICVFLFLGGWRAYVEMTTTPKKALEIAAFASKWNWSFVHPNGVRDANLHVPVDTPVRMVMTSTDVLHSFFVPAFRIKQDLVPRRYTYTWFQATKPGTYRLYCTEYCGTDHSMMKQVVVVHDKGGYERYLAELKAASENMPPVDLGADLYKKRGCATCHTVDGSPKIGPSFKGIFGTKVTLASGETIDVDENYLRKSIEAPQAQARPGYPPSMPPYAGQLSEKELNGLIEYIKSLK